MHDNDSARNDDARLTAISALDGRYCNKLDVLAPMVSEFGLIRYRVRVECAWLVWLAETAGVTALPAFAKADRDFVDAIAAEFDPPAAAELEPLRGA